MEQIRVVRTADGINMGIFRRCMTESPRRYQSSQIFMKKYVANFEMRTMSNSISIVRNFRGEFRI